MSDNFLENILFFPVKEKKRLNKAKQIRDLSQNGTINLTDALHRTIITRYEHNQELWFSNSELSLYFKYINSNQETKMKMTNELISKFGFNRFQEIEKYANWFHKLQQKK